MSKLNGAATVQVCGCVEVWVLHLFVPNRKEKRIVLVYMRQSGSISTCDKASWWHGRTFRKQGWLEDISRRTDNYATAVEFTGSIGAAAYREREGGEEGERAREREEEEVQILCGDLEQEPRGADYTWGLSCQRESSQLDPFIAWSGLRGCISQCSRRSR